MLVLIDGDLVQRWSLRSLHSTATILVGARRGDCESVWRPSGSEGEARELDEHLSNVLRPKQANVVLVVWPAPDRSLAAVLDVLERARADYPVDVILLLAGPIDPVDFNSGAFRGRGDWLRSALFIGRCDNTGRMIGDDERRTVYLALLHLVDAPPQDEAAVVQRLHWLGLVPRNAEEWTPARPLTAVGCEFLGRNRHDLVDVAHRYVRAVFAEEVRRGMANTTRIADLERVPESLLQALQSFRTGRRTAKDADQIRTFEAELPAPAAGPFANWSCPWVRQPAIAEGEIRLRRARVEALRHRETLLSSLAGIASAARENGRDIARSARDRITEPLRGSSLADLTAFLQSYFPAFSRLRTRRTTRDRTSCVPASEPPRRECVERFQAMEGSFASAATRLPSWFMVAAVAFASVLLIAGGVYALRRSWDGRVTAGLIFSAVILQAVFWWIARRNARRIARGMLDDWEAVISWLQRAFQAKVRWVVEKTYLMLEEQVIAHAETTGRELSSRLDRFFADWHDLLNAQEASHSSAAILKSFEVDEDDLRDYRERVLAFHRALIDNLTDLDGQQAAERALDEALQAIGDGLFERVQDTPVPFEQTENAIRVWSTTLNAPPLLARTPERPHNALHRTIILPTKYGNPLDPVAMAAIAVRARIHSAQITGPIGWSLKRGMSDEDAVRAMEVPRIPVA